MIPYEIREKLQNITNGIVLEGGTDYQSKTKSYLIQSVGSSKLSKRQLQSK